MLLPLCHVYLFIFYVIPCLYIRSLSVMLSRISFHVLYGSSYFMHVILIRGVDDITVFFTKRVVTGDLWLRIIGAGECGGAACAEKDFEFLKEIHGKDDQKVLQLQILGRETELRAREKELFIEKLKGNVYF
nr:hypothetical protein [Tanacetum cinerariifolium]